MKKDELIELMDLKIKEGHNIIQYEEILHRDTATPIMIEDVDELYNAYVKWRDSYEIIINNAKNFGAIFDFVYYSKIDEYSAKFGNVDYETKYSNILSVLQTHIEELKNIKLDEIN